MQWGVTTSLATVSFVPITHPNQEQHFHQTVITIYNNYKKGEINRIGNVRRYYYKHYNTSYLLSAG